MSWLEWISLALLLIVLTGWWLSYLAARLHRLHSRVEGAYAVLDAQLVRRAEATVELAHGDVSDPSLALLLAGAAAESLSAADASMAEREHVESQLTAALRMWLSDVGLVDAESLAIWPPMEAMDARAELSTRPTPSRCADVAPVESHSAVRVLADAHERVRMARRFYNDAVADTRRVRQRRVVRWCRLAGHTRLPRPFDFDDDLTTSTPVM